MTDGLIDEIFYEKKMYMIDRMKRIREVDPKNCMNFIDLFVKEILRVYLPFVFKNLFLFIKNSSKP